MRKVAIGLGLGLVMLSSAPAVDAATGPFPDVPATYWAASAISALKAQGIITGEADGKFHPAQPVTREQFAALIVRVEHLPAVTKGPAFTDLGASALSPAVETAAANGLMLGTTLTTFAPLEPITRAMAATIAVRALGLSQVALDLAPLTSGFSDASQIPSYATGSVVSAKRLGILQGYPSGDFKPNVTIDRAQAAVLIYRLETVPQTAIQHLAAVVATGVNAGSYTQQIAVGGSVGLWASVYDQSSVPVPAPVSWSASGGSAAGGSFTASAPGVYTVSASVPGTSIRRSFHITVAAPVRLALYGLPEVAAAGSRIQGTLTILSQLGSRDDVDAPQAVSLTFTPTSGTPITQTVQTRNGQAAFSFTPTAAGAYRVSATAPGLTSATAAFDVLAKPFGQLQVSTLTTVFPGSSSTFSISLPKGASESSPVQVTSSDPSVLSVGHGGSLAPKGLTVKATGLSPGQATVTVSNPLNAYSEQTFTVNVPALGALTLAPPAGTPAGVGATAVVGVNQTPALVAPPPDVHLTLKNPQGVLIADDTSQSSAGQSTFQVSEREAGTWTLTASAPGYTSATAAWVVTPGAPVQLIATGAPSTIVVAGQTAALQVQYADQYDNPVQSPVAVEISATGTAGTLSAASANLPGPGPAATFTAVQPGIEQVTVTSATNPTLAPLTVDFRVIATAADVASGKGVWLLESDWQQSSQQSLLTQLKSLGVTHVYIEIEETSLGFYGTSALRHFLYAAHDDGIAVIAWVYPYLYNVGYDISLTQEVAAYTAPTGDRPDAIAADIETNTATAAVTQYAQAVRQAMGPHGVFIAVTSPPIYHESYPYAALAPYVTEFAPMDYWHYTATQDTFLQAYDYVSQTVSLIRQLSGDPSAQVTVIGQTYDMFSGSGSGVFSPSPMEIQAAFQAASDQGAVGISFYRLPTATAPELQAISQLPYPDPGP